MKYYTYILKCNDDTLYVGSTNNLKNRLIEHNHAKKGAHYTKIRRPVKLVYSETFNTFRESRRREKEIQSWRRESKLNLIKQSKK